MSSVDALVTEYVSTPIFNEVVALLKRPQVPVGRGLIDKELNRSRDVPKSLMLSKTLAYMCEQDIVRRCIIDDESKFWLSERSLDNEAEICWLPKPNNIRVVYVLDSEQTNSKTTEVEPPAAAAVVTYIEATNQAGNPTLNNTTHSEPVVEVVKPLESVRSELALTVAKTVVKKTMDEAILEAFAPGDLYTQEEVLTKVGLHAASVTSRLSALSNRLGRLTKCRLKGGDTAVWTLTEGFSLAAFPQVECVIATRPRGKAALDKQKLSAAALSNPTAPAPETDRVVDGDGGGGGGGKNKGSLTVVGVTSDEEVCRTDTSVVSSIHTDGLESRQEGLMLTIDSDDVVYAVDDKGTLFVSAAMRNEADSSIQKRVDIVVKGCALTKLLTFVNKARPLMVDL